MREQPPINPFVPDRGVLPPFLAGRDAEQQELNAVIAGALILDSTPDIVRYRDRLAMVGYVWKPPGAGDRWQPGIPSLMRYVRPR